MSALCYAFPSDIIACIGLGVCALVQGELAYVLGELLCEFFLWWFARC
jgi:hypothetical protein